MNSETYLKLEYSILIKDGISLRVRTEPSYVENEVKALLTYKNPLLLNRIVANI